MFAPFFNYENILILCEEFCKWGNPGCRKYKIIVFLYCTRDMGGPSPKSTRPATRLDYFTKGAAMSRYETLVIVLTTIRLVFDILNTLLRRRNEDE